MKEQYTHRTDIHPILASRKDTLDDPATQARLDAAGIPPLVILDGADNRMREAILSGITMDGRVESRRAKAVRELKKQGIIP